MSGFSVGYLSVEELILELKTTTGTDQEKENAQKFLIFSNRHRLLCTLLLMNSFALEQS